MLRCMGPDGAIWLGLQMSNTEKRWYEQALRCARLRFMRYIHGRLHASSATRAPKFSHGMVALQGGDGGKSMSHSTEILLVIEG